MILLSILALISFMLIIAISFPIHIKINSGTIWIIKWIFVKIRIASRAESVKIDLKIFNHKIHFRNKKRPDTASNAVVSPKLSSGFKLTPSKLWLIVKDSTTRRLLKIGLIFGRRCLKASRIKKFKCNIGLSDYFQQGILMGVISGLPRTDSFEINGNFQETNRFLLILQIPAWQLLKSTVQFIVSFPYLGVHKLYLKLK